MTHAIYYYKLYCLLPSLQTTIPMYNKRQSLNQGPLWWRIHKVWGIHASTIIIHHHPDPMRGFLRQHHTLLILLLVRSLMWRLWNSPSLVDWGLDTSVRGGCWEVYAEKTAPTIIGHTRLSRYCFMIYLITITLSITFLINYARWHCTQFVWVGASWDFTLAAGSYT